MDRHQRTSLAPAPTPAEFEDPRQRELRDRLAQFQLSKAKKTATATSTLPPFATPSRRTSVIGPANPTAVPGPRPQPGAFTHRDSMLDLHQRTALYTPKRVTLQENVENLHPNTGATVPAFDLPPATPTPAPATPARYTSATTTSITSEIPVVSSTPSGIGASVSRADARRLELEQWLQTKGRTPAKSRPSILATPSSKLATPHAIVESPIHQRCKHASHTGSCPTAPAPAAGTPAKLGTPQRVSTPASIGPKADDSTPLAAISTPGTIRTPRVGGGTPVARRTAGDVSTNATISSLAQRLAAIKLGAEKEINADSLYLRLFGRLQVPGKARWPGPVAHPSWTKFTESEFFSSKISATAECFERHLLLSSCSAALNASSYEEGREILASAIDSSPSIRAVAFKSAYYWIFVARFEEKYGNYEEAVKAFDCTEEGVTEPFGLVQRAFGALLRRLPLTPQIDEQKEMDTKREISEWLNESDDTEDDDSAQRVDSPIPVVAVNAMKVSTPIAERVLAPAATPRSLGYPGSITKLTATPIGKAMRVALPDHAIIGEQSTLRTLLFPTPKAKAAPAPASPAPQPAETQTYNVIGDVEIDANIDMDVDLLAPEPNVEVSAADTVPALSAPKTPKFLAPLHAQVSTMGLDYFLTPVRRSRRISHYPQGPTATAIAVAPQATTTTTTATSVVSDEKSSSTDNDAKIAAMLEAQGIQYLPNPAIVASSFKDKWQQTYRSGRQSQSPVKVEDVEKADLEEHKVEEKADDSEEEKALAAKPQPKRRGRPAKKAAVPVGTEEEADEPMEAPKPARKGRSAAKRTATAPTKAKVQDKVPEEDQDAEEDADESKPAPRRSTRLAKKTPAPASAAKRR